MKYFRRNEIIRRKGEKEHFTFLGYQSAADIWIMDSREIQAVELAAAFESVPKREVLATLNQKAPTAATARA